MSRGGGAWRQEGNAAENAFQLPGAGANHLSEHYEEEYCGFQNKPAGKF